MTWLQENWMIAVVGLVVAVVLLWWLFGRARPAEIAPPTVEPAKPAKPLEPAKPEIIAAEPARFKPIVPKPAPATPAPPPAAEPAAKAPPPAPEPAAAPPPAPVAEPVAEAPTKPAAKPKPAAKKTATKAPAAKATVKKAAAKPPADAAAIPAEPTVPPPPAPAPAPTVAKADNLQLLKGVGPKLVVLLNGLGVTRFQQIADWTDADIARIDPQLGAFQGRIARDNLIDQASYLARSDKAGFEAKYGALGGEL
jgi:predicted flap endonuclease-1-like 5' DNA nuclease